MNLVFNLVSLLGAFLLFQVQPVISKFILPWFGGSPGVWTTCMLFFQIVLFGGYSYAHWLAGRKPRTQALIHVSMLLLAAVLFLPIAPVASLKPVDSLSPEPRILWLLLHTVGLPYFVLSATSPLVQVWFTHQFPKRSPWRLYSLSNIGSLTALLSYPVLIETRWDVEEQTHVWSWAFGAFVVLMSVCAWSNRVRPQEITPEGDLHPQTETHAVKTTWGRRLRWLALPAFASAMLLATTNHLCQDVAVIPFLWVAPLSLYLISFIICFDHPRWYVRSAWAIGGMIFIFLTSAIYNVDFWDAGFVAELVVLLGALLCLCMVCHGELARLKPDPRHLTEYYLMMSAGGAVGGLAVSEVAPLVFNTFFEWELGVLSGFVIVSWVAMRSLALTGIKRAAWVVGTLLALGCLTQWEISYSDRLERHRDFYGTLSVEESVDPDIHCTIRTFYSGSVKHGRQNMTPPHRQEPLTYYTPDTGSGIALATIKGRSGARVGIIGMGAGTVATYAEKGQTFRFYELNPAAEKLALKWFTFVPDMQARGAIYECVLGDARLSLEHEESQKFDVLLLDAFSGDSVPVHLLTREAFELYQRHLNPNGIIAVHVTNRALNLPPVVERVARECNLSTVRVARIPEQDYCYPTDYVLVSRDEAFIRSVKPQLPPWAKAIEVPVWTDHRHNLFQILMKR